MCISLKKCNEITEPHFPCAFPIVAYRFNFLVDRIIITSIATIIIRFCDRDLYCYHRVDLITITITITIAIIIAIITAIIIITMMTIIIIIICSLLINDIIIISIIITSLVH